MLFLCFSASPRRRKKKTVSSLSTVREVPGISQLRLWERRWLPARQETHSRCREHGRHQIYSALHLNRDRMQLCSSDDEQTTSFCAGFIRIRNAQISKVTFPRLLLRAVKGSDWRRESCSQMMSRSWKTSQRDLRVGMARRNTKLPVVPLLPAWVRSRQAHRSSPH